MTRLPIDGRKWPDLTRAEQTAVLDWIVDLCLVQGAAHSTAYRVAAEFALGVEVPLGAGRTHRAPRRKIRS